MKMAKKANLLSLLIKLTCVLSCIVVVTLVLFYLLWINRLTFTSSGDFKRRASFHSFVNFPAALQVDNSRDNTSNLSGYFIRETDTFKPHKSYQYDDRYPSTEDKIWIKVDTNTVLRRTTYYDTRPHFGRSVVIICLHDDEKERKVPSLFGKVTMSDGVTFCSPIQDWKTNGKIVLNWRDVILTHVLRIPLKDYPDSQPVQIQVTKDSECKESKLFPVMKVFYDSRNETKFATCVQKALFSGILPSRLINFIELNKFLGASYITIYFSKKLTNADELLTAASPYIETGLVEILDWRMNGMKAFDIAMSASATECVYRNIHRAHYMALHDIDEFLIPRKHLTWHGLIDDLKSQTNISNYASFSFANSLYKLDTEPVKQLTNFNSTRLCTPPVYFTRQTRNDNPETKHPKVMLDLSTTITAYCHDIKNWKDGIQKQYRVPTDLGLSNHYRVKTKGRTKGVSWMHDDTMDRYLNHIIPNLKKRCF